MEDQGTGPAYRIVTERLVIRCWDPRDASLLKAAVDASTAHLRPWMPWATLEPAPLESRVQYLRQCRGEFDQGTNFTYGVFTADEREVVGGTGLHTRPGPDAREIGYWIHALYTRRGFATEVSAALTRVAFEVDKVKRVEIICALENTKSAGVPRKLGFVHEANRRAWVTDADGNLHDSMFWTMLAAEYPDSLPSRAAITAYDAMGRRVL